MLTWRPLLAVSPERHTPVGDNVTPDLEAPRDEDGRRILERWYKLRADLVGSYVLPPVELAYRLAATAGEPAASETPAESVQTSEIFIEVQSVLPAGGEATDIRGLKPLRQVKTPTPVWLWVLICPAVSTAVPLRWFFNAGMAVSKRSLAAVLKFHVVSFVQPPKGVPPVPRSAPLCTWMAYFLFQSMSPAVAM